MMRTAIAGVLAFGLALCGAQSALAQKTPIPIPAGGLAGAARAQSVIAKPGSYVLTRNITVKKPGQDGVDVTASNVTIDLQGFTISGTGATGIGINAGSVSQVTIKNGFITAMGGAAVIVGPQSSVSAISAVGDVAAGGANAAIQAGSGSVITDNLVAGTGGVPGISCSTSCVARGNVLQNTGGLTFADNTSGYTGNVLNGANPQVSNGTQIGQNLCNGSLCP